MTDPVLIDSDVLIELLRGRNAAIIDRWIELRESSAVVAYSPVSSAEIWRGARRAERETIAALFDALPCIPIDAVIGKQAGEYLARFHFSHAMELGDALIAATAAAHGLRLWTRNKKHFPMRDVHHFSPSTS
jgi:predicted nucleic acid-binding protein